MLSPGMIVSGPRPFLLSLVRIINYNREKSQKFFGPSQRGVGWLAHRADLGGNGGFSWGSIRTVV